MQLIAPFKLGWIVILAVTFQLISDSGGDLSLRADDPVGCDDTLFHDDYDFLRDFYLETNGDSWSNTLANNNPWLKCDICNWYGIVCDNGRVVEINLPNNNVIGQYTIDADDFRNIEKFDLSGNNFNFSSFSSLDFDNALKYLDLSSNQISAYYFNFFEMSRKVEYLDISNNNLTQIFPNAFNLPLLEYLDVSNNLLTGSIPSYLSQLYVLKHLNLSGNDITGNFPEYISSYNRLNFLDLSDNRFTGCIPSSYSFHCDVQNNVFLDNNCTFDDPTFIEFCNGEVCDETLKLTAPISTCVGEKYTITAETGYANYQWSTGCEGPANRSANLNYSVRTCPGTYSVTITNDKGCTRVDSITIEEYIEPDRNTSVSFCEGGSVTVSGSTFSAPGNYQVLQFTGQGCSYTLYVSVSEEIRPRNTYNLSICEGSSKTIHGQAYNTSGTFTQTQYNPSGCDSLLTINVIMLLTYSSEEYYSVCPGQTAFHDGVLYGVGDTEKTYTAQNGCDSIVTIHVSELETFNTNITLEACEGETVIHDGLAYEIGTDTRNYTAQNGCDSILHITINGLSGSSTTETYSICNGQSVNVLGSDYTGGVFNIPYLNNVGCASNLRLTVNESPPYIIRDTIIMCNGVQVQYDDLHYYSTPGSFTINKQDNDGCNYIVELEVPGGESNREDIYLFRCDNEPIEVNGDLIYGSLDVQRLTNASGCDSMLWVHVDSRYSNIERMYLDYCAEDFPRINDITYFQEGVHQQNLINDAGCDSTLLIFLTKLDNTWEDIEVQICPNQEITINGITYNGPGFDQQHLTNAIGCDSLLTIEIIEKDIIETEFYHTLCGNETITVGGQVYSETINDTQTYETGNGCDSVVYIFIEKYEHTSQMVFDRLCTGDKLTYNAEEIIAGGTYIQNLENKNGCDSTLTIIIEEFSPTVSYNERETCEGDPWFENGQNLFTDGIHTQHILNAVGCDSTITIDLTVHAHTSETMDLQVCRDQTRYVNEIAYNTGGTFNQNLANSAGCDSTLTIVVEIVDEVRAEYHEDICEGESTTINGEVFDVTRTTEQFFISSIGCDSILTVSVVLHSHTFGQVETTVCAGDERMINGTVYVSGGTYIQNTTNSAGCDSTITVFVEELLPTSSSSSYEMCEGDPITINSINYEFGGEFSQMFTNSVGCDSTFYISILEHPDTEHTIYRYICPGEFTSVNNITYNSPNLYEQNYTNARGCDSTLFINVQYSAPKDTTLFDFICDEGVYDFKGGTYYTQGMYQFDTLTQRGCDSTIYLDLGLLTGTDTTIYRTICKNEPYQFGSKKLYNAGSYFDEIIIGGCKTPTTLELTVLEPVYGYTEVHKCEGDLFWFNGKYESKAGLYFKTIQSSAGCDSILTTELFYETAKETVIDTFLCHGESLYFDFYFYDTPGNYRIKRKTRYGCDSIVKLNLEWYDNEASIFNRDVCEGETVVFEGKEYGVGIYAGEYFDGFCTKDFELTVDETTLQKLNETILLCEGDEQEFLGHLFDSTGQFYLGEAIGTCEFIEYVNVIQSTVEGSINELFLCEGSSMEIGDLEINKAGEYTIEQCDGVNTYSVNFISGDTVFMEHKINPGQSVLIESISYTESGEYFIEVGENAGCTSMIQLVILVEACGGERTSEQSLCSGDIFKFYGKEISETGDYEYIKNLGFACDSIIKLKIEFESIPAFNIEGEPIICSGETNLISGPDGFEYLWSSGEKTQEISVDKSGDAELTIFDANGCSASAIYSTKVISFPAVLDIYKTDPSECGVEDGSILVDVPESSNYSYSKDGGLNWQESPVFENLGAGNYSILLADLSLTCTRENTFEITLKNNGIPRIIDVIVSQPNDCIDRKGSILVFMESSEIPMEYSIDSGLTWTEGNYFSDLDDGFYQLLISPIGSECVNNFTEIIEIKNKANLETEVSIFSPLSCADSGDAIALVNISEGTAPYHFSWSHGSSEFIGSGLNAGKHSVTVQDANGCVQVMDFEVENIDLEEITIDFRDSILCENDTLRYVELDSLFQYQLFKDDVFQGEGNEFEITETGHYQVYAESEGGCATASDFLIEEPSSEEIGADFLLSSNGVVGEDIYIVNVSDPMPEIYNWEFDSSRVENEILDSLTQRMNFIDTGEYKINYIVDNDGCLVNIEKSIHIYPDSTSLEKDSTNINIGLEYWSVSPNPNDGNFNVEIELNKPGTITLLLFDMHGSVISYISLGGKDKYTQKIKLPSSQTGIYAILLSHNGKVSQKNILVIN